MVRRDWNRGYCSALGARDIGYEFYFWHYILLVGGIFMRTYMKSSSSPVSKSPFACTRSSLFISSTSFSTASPTISFVLAPVHTMRPVLKMIEKHHSKKKASPGKRKHHQEKESITRKKKASYCLTKISMQECDIVTKHIQPFNSRYPNAFNVQVYGARVAQHIKPFDLRYLVIYRERESGSWRHMR